MKKDKIINLLEELIKAVKEQPERKFSSRFVTLSDYWILDKETGFEWGPSSEETMNLEAAAKYCKDQGGRLPTVKELHSLVDYDKYDPAINTEFFGDTKTGEWYWSESHYQNLDSSGYAWCVGFSYGHVDSYHKGRDSYVRPVRASQ